MLIDLLASRGEEFQNSTLSRPAQWLADIISGGESISGEYVGPSAAMGVAAYFAAIRAISEDVGKLPLITYKRLARGKERATTHPVYSLLHDAPNDDMTAMAFRETLTSHALGWSGGYAEIVRDQAGRPVAMYPLDPTTVTPEHDRQTRALMYRVRQSAGKDVLLRPDQVLHIHGLGFEGVTGYALTQIAKNSLGGAIAAQKHAQAYFKNGATPAGMIEVPHMLKKEAFERLRNSFSERYEGSQNKYKTIILEDGAKFSAVSTDPEKSQLITTLQFHVEDVCRWFRVPPHKIQHLLRSTNNNIEQQSIEYVGDTLQPWLVRWEQEINRKLLLPGERRTYFAEHLVVGLLRGDSAARSAFYRELFNIGSLSQNDIRESENMNPIEYGDTYYVNGAMMPVDLASQGLKQAPEEAPSDDNQPRPAPATASAARRLMDAHKTLLARELEQALVIERDRIVKARQRSDFAAWLAKFYESRPETLFQAVSPIIDAFSGAFWALFSENLPTESLLQDIHLHTREMIARHVNASVADAGSDEKVLAWVTSGRSQSFASAELESLSQIITKHAKEA